MSPAVPLPEPQTPSLDDVYRAHVELAWRTARYLGVRPEDAEDVVHEVFLVIERRLADYDPARAEGASIRSWIAGITRNVVMHHHRASARRADKLARIEPPEGDGLTPEELMSRREAAEVLTAFLDELDADKREVFVLGELEGLAGPEIADALQANLNTVYARLRAARQAFARRVARLDATRRREGG